MEDYCVKTIEGVLARAKYSKIDTYDNLVEGLIYNLHNFRGLKNPNRGRFVNCGDILLETDHVFIYIEPYDYEDNIKVVLILENEAGREDYIRIKTRVESYLEAHNLIL